MDESVVYADIPGFPGYKVGRDGTVWSQWERGRWKRRRDSWHRISTPPDNKGYPQLNLYNPEEGTRKHCKLHKIVSSVFLGPIPADNVVRHLDGNPRNNAVENLAYGTALENAQDTIRHGRTNKGTKCPSSKLTDDDVRAIKAKIRSGGQQMRIAKEYGVNNSTICDIARGRTWCHVEETSDAH